MAALTFVVWPESGHVVPAARFGRSVEALGHDVTFATFADFAPMFGGAGARVQVIGEAVFPRGSLSHALDLGERRALAAYMDFWASARPFGAAPPDVAIVDALMPAASLAALRAGARGVAVLSTGLPYTREGDLPPLTSGLGVGGAAARLRGRAAWAAKLGARAALRPVLRASGRPDLRDRLRRLSRDAGAADDIVRDDAALGYGLRLPELVLCPRAFELPYEVPARRRYVEPCVLEAGARADDAAFPWQRVGGDGGLVLCAFGSQTHRYRAGVLTSLLRAVVDEARRRPATCFVIAHGALDRAALGPAPENCVLAPTVPQVALLERARAFITHAGLNSIKEALSFGVPLLVFPMVNDQPGNAARVEHHGVGVRGRAADGARVVPRALEALLAEGPLRERARAMGEAFRAVAAAAPGAHLLDRAARGDFAAVFAASS